MTRYFLAFLIIGQLSLGCKSEDNEQHYECIGQVSFRRSYAGNGQLSDTALAAVEKKNPSFMYPTHTFEDTMLAMLTQSGIAYKNDLLLDKIASNLIDTIFITPNNTLVDTAFINYNKNKETGTASIEIRNGKLIDSIAIKDEVFSHTFSLYILNEKAMFIFVNQYYIMNGDNYEVSIYKKR